MHQRSQGRLPRTVLDYFGKIYFGGFIMVFIRFILGLLEGVGHAIGYAKH